METLATQDQETLRAQLQQARERLDGLVRDLRDVDAELEGLAFEGQRYRLLQQACSALEELEGLGAAELFWGDGLAGGAGQEHLRRARGRVDVFEKRLGETEDRRQAILEEIERQQESTEFIQEDIYQLQREEEERKLEWVVERELDTLPVTESVMPWSRGGEDDQRFRKSLAAALLLSLLFGLLFPQIDLPLPEPGEPLEVPERLARLIQEERPAPPPPPAREQPEPTQEEEPEPTEPVVAEEPAPEAKPEETAKSQGILAFREKFSGLADVEPEARLGAKARISSSGEVGSSRPTRSMVTTQAPGSSGGINLAGLSRDIAGGGGDGIERVEVARATSSIGTGSGAGRPLSKGPGPARTDEEIQIVFDRHKAALYRLYNRELRKNPTLQGQMVLRLTIAPDGSVSLCELHSTDMNAPALSTQVVERVRTFDFGAKEGVPPVTILYPIDFLPAA